MARLLKEVVAQARDHGIYNKHYGARQMLTVEQLKAQRKKQRKQRKAGRK